MLRVMTEAGGVARPGGGKHRAGKRGGRRLAAAAAPLAAAALFLFLLLFSVRSFSSMSSDGGSIEDAAFQPADGGRTAGHAAERGAHDPSPLRSGGSGGHHSSWLSAAALWAEENQEQVGGMWGHPQAWAVEACATRMDAVCDGRRSM